MKARKGHTESLVPETWKTAQLFSMTRVFHTDIVFVRVKS